MFAGSQCQSALQVQSPTSSYVHIIVIVCLLLLIIIIVVVVIVSLWYVRKNQRLHGMYNPAEEEQRRTTPVPIEHMLASDGRELLI